MLTCFDLYFLMCSSKFPVMMYFSGYDLYLLAGTLPCWLRRQPHVVVEAEGGGWSLVVDWLLPLLSGWCTAMCVCVVLCPACLPACMHACIHQLMELDSCLTTVNRCGPVWWQAGCSVQ